MAEKKPFYITTTLPYVNAAPHVGFALEIVQADILARYHELMGDEVFFNTGTDEHGLKIYKKAEEEGRSPQEYVDEYAAKFRALKKELNLLSDLHFVRTTDPSHILAAQEIWRRCSAKGDICKKKFKGLYCVGDEMFLRASDLVNGRCPNHPTIDPIEIEEENYFFKLSNYQAQLKSYLEDPARTISESYRKWALDFVTAGLEDLSISRSKERLSWGISVPEDDTQVMYVWFDALTNYISTLGWPEDKEGLYKKFWVEGETLQLAGKDQIRFQSIIWQAMLISAGLPQTKCILYHGFITSGGQKMSKSLGNVVDPIAIVEEYGIDALRYFLARHIHPFEDSDFTMENFKEMYNANLANGLGNLVARIMKLAEENLEKGTRPEVAGFPKNYTNALERFDVQAAIDEVFRYIKALDQKITTTEPFKLIKSDKEAGKKLIFELTQELYIIGRMLNPFMPDTNAKIKRAIIDNKKPENLFSRKD